MSLLFFQGPLNDWIGLLGASSVPWRLLGVLSLLLLLFHYLLPRLWVHLKRERLYRRMPSPVTSPIMGRILGHLEVYWKAPAQLRKLPPSVCFHYIVNQLVRPMQKAGESLLLLRLGPLRKVIVIKGDAAKALLSGSKHLEKSPEYSFFKEFIGETLINGNVADWKVRRKMLVPSFHLDILHTFLPAMNAHCRVFCRVIASKMDASTGRALLPDIRPLMDKCTLDILCETAMGVTLNTQEKEMAELQVAGLSAQQIADLQVIILSGIDLLCRRIMKPWLHPNFLYRHSALGRKAARLTATGRGFVRLVLSERRDTLSRGNLGNDLPERKRLSFLDHLLVSHLKGDAGALPLTAIEEQVCEIMIAGVDTSSTALQMALLLLGLHADKQALIHQELDTIFGDNTERTISLEDLRQMTYLEMAIKEILRLYPGVPFLGRILSEDLQMDKYLVPEGTNVYVNVAAIHRDPDVWTDADDFTPERFSPESTELGLTSSYLPFSAGPRNCLGSRYAMLVLKLFLATLLRVYTVRSLTAQEDIQLGFIIFAKPNAPISIEFTPRK